MNYYAKIFMNCLIYNSKGKIILNIYMKFRERGRRGTIVRRVGTDSVFRLCYSSDAARILRQKTVFAATCAQKASFNPVLLPTWLNEEEKRKCSTPFPCHLSNQVGR